MAKNRTTDYILIATSILIPLLIVATKNQKFKKLITVSDTAKKQGIKLRPSKKAIRKARIIYKQFIIPLRKLLPGNIVISSWYRNSQLNDILKGSKTSQHLTGQAIDLIYIENGVKRNDILKEYLIELPFDQIIEYPEHIHISFSRNPRKQYFTGHY